MNRHELEQRRDALLAEAQTLITRADGTLPDADATRFDEIEAEVKRIKTDLARYDELDKLVESRSVERGAVFETFNTNTRHTGSPFGANRDMPRTRDEWRDAASHALDAISGDMDDKAATRAQWVIDGDFDFARRMATVSDPAYEAAFLKLAMDPILGHNRLTSEERTALERTMTISTDTAGGFMSPTHLDPTIMLTSDGSNNVLRQIARVVTLRDGDTWNGISSAGVTASFDAELAEVSDDSPEVANPSIPVHTARAFVQWSIEAGQDIAGLREELARVFADAKDVLEGEMYNTGSGSGQPTGVWTALDANTNVELTSTTADVIGAVDLHAMYKAVPQRFRGRGAWLMHPEWALKIKELGTAVSNTFSGDLTVAGPEKILNHPVYESDDCPNLTTTTSLDPRIIFGDFRNFVIVDKPGFNLELIPHLFNTSNNRPDGRRGLFGWWRTGSDSVNDLGLRLLHDRTSA